MRKILIILALVAVVLTAWRVLFVRTIAGQYRDKTIIRWVTDGNPARQQQIEEFEQLNPDIHVVWDFGGNAMQKTMIQISGRRGPDVFDIYSADVFYQFASSRALLDLNPLIAADNERIARDNVILHQQNLAAQAGIGAITQPDAIIPSQAPVLSGTRLDDFGQYNVHVTGFNRWCQVHGLPQSATYLEYPMTLDLFWPGKLDQLSYQGDILAVPTNVSGNVITYNRDIFERHNVPFPGVRFTAEWSRLHDTLRDGPLPDDWRALFQQHELVLPEDPQLVTRAAAVRWSICAGPQGPDAYEIRREGPHLRVYRDGGRWTTDECLETLRQVTRKTPDGRMYETFGIIPVWAASFVFAAGGDYFSPDKQQSIINQEGGRNGLTFVGRLWQEIDGIRLAPALTDSLSGSTSQDWPVNFKGGQVAMVSAGRWVLSITGPTFNYGYAPIPTFPGVPDGRRQVVMPARTSAIARDCRNPEAAFRFLRYLAGREYADSLQRSGDGFSGTRWYTQEETREPWATFHPTYPEVRCRMCARIRTQAEATRQPNPLKGLSDDALKAAADREWASLTPLEQQVVEDSVRSEMDILITALSQARSDAFSPYVPPSRYSQELNTLQDRVRGGRLAPEKWADEMHRVFSTYLQENLHPERLAGLYHTGNIIGVGLLLLALLALLVWLRRRRQVALDAALNWAGVGAPRQIASFSRRETMAACWFLAPNLIGFLVFTSLPVLASFCGSFTELNTLKEEISFVGFKQFVDILRSRHFWYYLFNTVVLLLGLPITMAGSLILALILNNKLRGTVFFRTMFYLPSVVSGVAIFLLWKWIYNTDSGLLNMLLRNYAGFSDPPGWLTGTGKLFGLEFFWAKPALIMMGVWMGAGGPNMLLYLAGLSSIPPDLYEAASIDGAGPWQRFWTITWPLLTPTTFFILIVGIIGGLQGGFETAYVMTSGGPEESTTTLGYFIYQTAFFEFRMGAAAAGAWLLFLIIMSITLLGWRFGNRGVHYEV